MSLQQEIYSSKGRLLKEMDDDYYRGNYREQVRFIWSCPDVASFFDIADLLGSNGLHDDIVREVYGGKGTNLGKLWAISDLRGNIPPGFVVSSDVWGNIVNAGGFDQTEGVFEWDTFSEYQEAILEEVEKLEEETGQTLGGTDNPLFVSARSGASQSLPGAMDTYLNIGLNDETFPVLAKEIGDRSEERCVGKECRSRWSPYH